MENTTQFPAGGRPHPQQSRGNGEGVLGKILSFLKPQEKPTPNNPLLKLAEEVKKPPLPETTLQTNLAIVTTGFLNPHADGSCHPETGVVADAFRELVESKPDDIKSQADLVMACRALDMVRSGKPLGTAEINSLRNLRARQNLIIEASRKEIQAKATIDTTAETAQLLAPIDAKQMKLDEVRTALEAGIPRIEEPPKTDTFDPATSTWSMPGVDMDAQLMSALVRVYGHRLKAPDDARAAVQFPEEPVRRKMTKDEQVQLLASIKSFEQALFASQPTATDQASQQPRLEVLPPQQPPTRIAQEERIAA